MYAGSALRSMRGISYTPPCSYWQGHGGKGKLRMCMFVYGCVYIYVYMCMVIHICIYIYMPGQRCAA